MILTDDEKRSFARYKASLIQTDTPIFQLLLSASGIEYKQWFYSPEYWQEKIGKDITPLIGAGYLRVNNNNLCALTEKAVKHLQAYSGQVSYNFGAIGVYNQ